MPRLLFVNASPRGARSESLRIAQAVLASAPARYAVDRLDLFADPLPPFATTE
ncbi:MAG: NAD(P)H-dependent oxidoreductase, partial [Solirubrobacterales bacterium]|nr:NAD(P)H-dependent oxidoreductase [Solirubrobacterales bacterium]